MPGECASDGALFISPSLRHEKMTARSIFCGGEYVAGSAYLAYVKIILIIID